MIFGFLTPDIVSGDGRSQTNTPSPPVYHMQHVKSLKQTNLWPNLGV